MKKLRVVLFKGKGFISKAIQWQTRSKYSHVGIVIYDSERPGEHTLYEAYHFGGVRKDRNYYTLQEDIETYIVPGMVGSFVDNVENFLERQIGKSYDFLAVLRFVSRRRIKKNDSYFCSELVVDALRAGEVSILRGDSSMFSPRDVSISPVLINVSGLDYGGSI